MNLNIILKCFMNTDPVNSAPIPIVPELIPNPVPSYDEKGQITLNISRTLHEWYSNQKTDGAFPVDPVLESHAKEYINIFDDAYSCGANCSDIIIHFLQKYHTMLHPDTFINATLYLLEKNSADLDFIEKIDNIGLFSVNYDDNSFIVSSEAIKCYLAEMENLVKQFRKFTNLNTDTVSTTTNVVSNNNSDSNEEPYEPTLQELQQALRKDGFIKKAVNAMITRTKTTVPPSQETPIPSSPPSPSLSPTPDEVTVYNIPVPDSGVTSLPSAPRPGFSSSGSDHTFAFNDENPNLSIIVLTIASFVVINAIAWYTRTYHKDTLVPSTIEGNDGVGLASVYEPIVIQNLAITILTCLFPTLMFYYTFRYYYYNRTRIVFKG